MSTVKLCVSIPPALRDALNSLVPPGKRSATVAAGLLDQLAIRAQRRLAEQDCVAGCFTSARKAKTSEPRR